MILEYLKLIPTMVGISPYLAVNCILSLMNLEYLLDYVTIEIIGLVLLTLAGILCLCFQSFWPVLLPIICASISYFLA